jgi:hypothetical protein
MTTETKLQLREDVQASEYGKCSPGLKNLELTLLVNRWIKLNEEALSK